MKDFRISGICQAKKGLLFLRDCGAPATANCHLCGRPICQNHQIEDEMKYICPECFTQKDPSGQSKPNVRTRTGLGAMSRYRTRHGYYNRYGYFPYYYGSSHYYSDRDYRTFEDQSAAAEASGEEPTWAEAVAGAAEQDSGEYDDIEDFMES